MSVALAQSPQTNPPNSPTANATSAAAPTLADCDRLVTVLEARKPADAGVTVEQVRAYKTSNNAKACHDALLRIDPSAANSQDGATNIVVQQPAPAVRVDQAAPQVTVQQPQPQVTVRQPQPEITVRQPAPTVTVEIPQPEIVVKMPRPEVNVAMVQPQVQVNQPPPRVQVTQPQQQPQVQVQPAQPRVDVQQAGTQPNVQVQESNAPPTVKYERAEPKVVINQAKGEPKVRVENAQEAQRGGERDAASPSDRTQGLAPTAGRQNIAVSQLKKMNLFDARGNQLGDVEQVIQGQDGKRYIVVGVGGFLGIGEKHVLIPVENVVIRNNRLMTEGLTNEQVKTRPIFDRNNREFKEVDTNATLEIAAS